MKVLIVRVSSLGDVVHNMPMVADILRHYPDAAVDWVVEESYVSLVELNAGVRNVIPFALRRWRKQLLTAGTRREFIAFRQALRSEAYDFVFDTQGLLKTGLVLAMARLAAGGRRVGLANGTEGSGYEGASRIFHHTSVPVPLRTHGVLRGRLVAADTMGYTVDTPADFMLKTPQTWHGNPPAWMPKTPYIAFFHATARAAKQWERANWIRLAESISGRGLPILLPWGSPSERDAAQQLASHMPNAHVLPKLEMLDAVALARHAHLAVGVDTGLTHIAAAYNRPTIELYCDSPRWKTEGDWSPGIINLGDQGAPPSAEAVIAAAHALLDASDRTSASLEG